MEDNEDGIAKIEIKAPHSAKLTVFIQGTKVNHDVIILTCHDMGCSYTQFSDFLKTDTMRPILKCFMWVHLLVPGQGPKDCDLPNDYRFPTLDEIAEDIVAVMDHLKARHAVLFGEGAGANILARFAINHDDRVIGAAFVDLIGHSENLITRTTRKISVTRKLSSHGMHHAAEEYLIHHRFGSMKSSQETEVVLHNSVTAFIQSLNSTMNPNNLTYYITAYMNRTSLKDKIVTLRCPILLVTAQHAAQMHHVIDIHHSMHRDKVEMILIDNVSNVMIEAPEKLAESFQLFLQGVGLGSSIANRKLSTISSGSGSSDPEKRVRSISMADYDQPRGQTFYRKISNVTAPEISP